MTKKIEYTNTQNEKVYEFPDFYSFIEHSFEEFIKRIKELDSADLENRLKDNSFFHLPPTKQRFINMIKYINKELLNILKLCYQGAILNAGEKMINLFGECNSKLGRYLIEPYINYFSVEIEQDTFYYQMRDEKKGVTVDNCWHVPFNMRYNAYAGRYSIPGFPCLYLADTLDTANQELGALEKDKRWYSTFSIKKGKKIALIDLSSPIEQERNNMNNYNQLAFILSFPVRLLCSTQAKHSGANCEEYFFSQLICHALFMGSNKRVFCNFNGIRYTSTKDKDHKGKCLILPARYSSSKPKTEGFSDELQKKWEASIPKIYRKKVLITF